MLTKIALRVACLACLQGLAGARFLARRAAGEASLAPPAGASACSEGFPRLAAYGVEMQLRFRLPGDAPEAARTQAGLGSAVFFNQSNELGALAAHGRFAQLYIHKPDTESHEHYICTFEFPTRLLCTDAKMASKQYRYGVSVSPVTCVATGLSLYQLSGFDVLDGIKAPVVGTGQLRWHRGAVPILDSELREAGGAIERTAVSASPCGGGYPPMNDTAYNLTLSELSQRGDSASPSLHSGSLSLSFFNQTEAKSGRADATGQFVQAFTPEMNCYLLCVFSPGATDLTCVDAVHGTFFVQMMVITGEACEPQSLSSIVVYGYRQVTTDSGTATESLVALESSAPATWVSLLPGHSYGLRVRTLAETADTHRALYGSREVEHSFAALAGEGLGNSAAFSLLTVGSQSGLCMSPTFGDAFSELMCVQAGGGRFIASYLPNATLNGLQMPWGWGVSEGSQRASLSSA